MYRVHPRLILYSVQAKPDAIESLEGGTVFDWYWMLQRATLVSMRGAGKETWE